MPGTNLRLRYAVIVSFRVLLNGTDLDDIASKVSPGSLAHPAVGGMHIGITRSNQQRQACAPMRCSSRRTSTVPCQLMLHPGLWRVQACGTSVLFAVAAGKSSTELARALTWLAHQGLEFCVPYHQPASPSTVSSTVCCTYTVQTLTDLC